MGNFSFSTITPALFSVARSTAAGGLAGGAALLVVMVATAYGYPISANQAAALVGGVVWLVVHLTPDSMKDHVKALASKLNVSSKDVASQLLELIPQTDASFPGKDGSAATNLSNISTGGKI